MTGLCAGACLPQPLTVLSVSLHSEEGEGQLSLATEAGLVLSGYREEFQPTRDLQLPVTAARLELRCEVHCWALITYLGDLSLSHCGSDLSGQSFCVSQQQRNDLGQTSLLLLLILS